MTLSQEHLLQVDQHWAVQSIGAEGVIGYGNGGTALG